VLVIAEPGCTHEGRFDALVRLLHKAADGGANVFKPQWVSDVDAMLARRHIGLDHPKRAYYARAYRWLNFPVAWHGELARQSHARGMQYAVTAFLPQDVATVAPFVEYLKVSSFEACDVDLLSALRVVPATQVLISCGMSTTTPYDALAITVKLPCWWDVHVLHCVSSYPAPLAALNLRILSRDDARPVFDGYSDHSRDLRVGMVAVAAGASIIETHFRLDTCDPANPDYAVAFTPDEFAQYVHNIRDAEVMLGTGEKQVQACEAWALPYKVTG